MNDTVRAFDVPEPMSLAGTERSKRVLAPEPERIRLNAEKDEGQEGRGREIAQEAMREDKRIWMRRSGGALEQVFVIRIFEDAAECCWVQPDGAALVRPWPFTRIAQDEIAAGEEGAIPQSEGVAAYALVKNLYHAREEKRRKGIGYDRVVPLHVFDPDTGEFHEIRDEVRVNAAWSGNFSPKDVADGESPFERVEVKVSDHSGDRRDPTMFTTPIQFVRDQMAYLKYIDRLRSVGREEGIEEYIRETRERELANMIAQRREEWEFKDLIRRQGGYEDRAAIGDVTVRVFFEPRNNVYILTGWKEGGATSDADADGGSGERAEFEISVNSDWNLSKNEAKKAFEFAVAQLRAGKSIVDSGASTEKYIGSLSAVK